MYNFVCSQYMYQADCVIIVYSITDRTSFEEAQSIFNWTTRMRDQEIPTVKT